jgi:hypothetical protein
MGVAVGVVFAAAPAIRAGAAVSPARAVSSGGASTLTVSGGACSRVAAYPPKTERANSPGISSAIIRFIIASILLYVSSITIICLMGW